MSFVLWYPKCTKKETVYYWLANVVVVLLVAFEEKEREMQSSLVGLERGLLHTPKATVVLPRLLTSFQRIVVSSSSVQSYIITSTHHVRR